MNTTSTTNRTPEQIRADLQGERDQLQHAVEDLRGQTTEAIGKVRSRLPIALAAAGGLGLLRVLARHRRG